MKRLRAPTTRALPVAACALVAAVATGLAVAADTPGKVGKAIIVGKAKPGVVRASEPYVIGLAVPHLRDPYWVNEVYGVLDQAKKDGVKSVRFVSAGGYANLQDQLNQIANLAQVGVDGIILGAVDFQGTKPAVEDAVRAGVPVMNASTPTNSDKVGWILVDDVTVGKLQAQFVAKQLPKGGQAAALNGPAAASWTRTRATAFRNELKKLNPKIRLVAERNSELDRAEAANITNNLIEAFPDLDFITCVADFLCKGSVDAIRAAGKKGHPRISTATWNRDTQQMLEQGYIDYIVGERPVLTGRLAVNALVQQLNGKTIPRITVVPVTGYTRANIGKVNLGLETAPKGFKPPS
jgi:protein TorT